MCFVHPFDDPQVIAGAGTVALEMLEDAPDLDAIVVPIGGGGLMSGVSIAARAVKPDIELIGVEAELYPSMKCAIEGVHLPLGGDTLAEGIAVKHPGALTSRILADFATDVVLVSERDLERAVAMLAGIEKSVVEGAGAAGLAAMLADPDRFKGKKVATILCGGNIDTHLLANVLVRDLVRQGRIARLHVAAHDQPGALAAITAKVYEAGVNVIEINHSRIFTALPAKDTLIEVECEARDAPRSTMSSRDSKRPDSGSSGRHSTRPSPSREGDRRSERGYSRCPYPPTASRRSPFPQGERGIRHTAFNPLSLIQSLSKRVYQPHKGERNHRREAAG